MTDSKTNNRVKIFDTTLRDGQQCPGAGMSFERNLEYARLACELRVDVLEAGFPSASQLDFEIVYTIAKEITHASYKPVIAALCQMREQQVIRTIESLAPLTSLKLARLHVYLPVDPQLMPASLGELANNKSQLIADLHKLVKLAVDAGCEVEFSPEGYSRMHENFDFTTDLIRAAVEAGATIINCPDTIGGACEIEGSEYFVENMKKHAQIIKKEFPKHEITWSVHCHNDFGLAVQNTINAVFNGPARQIEGCINGVGERAGNAALEQCIMLIKQFGSQANTKEPFYTTIATEKLQAISDFVNKYMLPRQPHGPVTCDNAAKHSSGGHTNAILKNPLAYQPFDPKDVGKEVTFLFGPMSGSNHAKSIIESFDYLCTEDEKAKIAQYIKDYYSQRRKGITDKELLHAYFEYRKPIKIEGIDYEQKNNQGKITLHGQFFENHGTIEQDFFEPNSGLTAVKNMLEKKLGDLQILHQENRSEIVNAYPSNSVRMIIIDNDKRQFEGTGEDEDITIASIYALIDAANHAYIERHFSAHQLNKI